MTSKATIHVVDDDEPTRTALIRLLRASGFEAIGYSSAGEFLINRPGDGLGCLLLDIHMPGPSGLDLQAALREQEIACPVIFMTGHADVPSCVAAMKGGALDYLEKPVDTNVLLDAIKRALQRDHESRAARQERNELWSSFKSLTPRERQVFDLVVSGKLNKQIADALDIAERTVKAQRASLMSKLGTDSAAGLGRLAERLRTTGDVLG
jgi:FixJ family two-component response regulator